MFTSAASTRSDRLALALAALLLAAYVVLRYGDSVRTFLVLDDFWILRDASRADWSPGGLAQLFQFTQTGFQLYRPLTQRAYFFVLHAVFGTDTSGFHLVQLTCFASNVLLAMAIATRLTASRLTASRLAGFAVALLYAAAPGHAVAVYWMAAFTMTGTTFVVFLMVRCWQTSARLTRLVAVTLLQIVALLCSEHAMTAPALLLCVAAFSPQREGWRTVLRDLSGALLAVVVYGGLKVAYYSSLRWPAFGYELSASPLTMLANIGWYACATVNALTLLNPSRLGAVLLGGAIVVVAGVASVLALRGRRPWRLLACGLDFFLIGCAPIAPLAHHFYEYLVGIAALGTALAIVGALRLVAPPRSVPALAVGASLLVVSVDATTNNAAARNAVFEMVELAARAGETILMNLGHLRSTQAPGVSVIVTRDPGTVLLVETGDVGRVFFTPPLDVSVGSPPVPPAAEPSYYLDRPNVPLAPDERPFWWNPRFDWIREWVPLLNSWYVRLTAG